MAAIVPAIEPDRLELAKEIARADHEIGTETPKSLSESGVEKLKRRKMDFQLSRRQRSAMADHSQAEQDYVNAADELFADFDRLQ